MRSAKRTARAVATAIALAVPLSLHLALVAFYPAGVGEELLTAPDAQEYAWMASTLAQEHRLTLPFGQRRLPPRYPWGFPALLAAAMEIVPLPPWQLHWWSTLAALATIALTFFCGITVSAGISGTPRLVMNAALCSVLATSPLLLCWSTQVMSDVAATLCLAVVLALWLRVTTQGGARAAVALGLAAAYGSTVRVTNVLAAAVVIASLALARRSLKWVVIGLAPPFAAAAAVSFRLYGAPWRGGYRLWVPNAFDRVWVAFNLRYLLHPPVAQWGVGTLALYARAWTGWRDPTLLMLSPIVTVLAAFGLWALFRRGGSSRLVAMFIAASAALIQALYLVYEWQGARFILPLAPLLVVAAVAGASSALDALAAWDWRRPRVAIVALPLLAALGHHALALRYSFRLAYRPPPMHEAFDLARRHLRPGSLLISDLSSPLLHLYFAEPGRHPVLPILVADAIPFGEQHLSLLAQFPERRHLLPPVLAIEGGQLSPSSAAGLEILRASLAAGTPVDLLLLNAPETSTAHGTLLRAMGSEGIRVRGWVDLGPMQIFQLHLGPGRRTIRR